MSEHRQYDEKNELLEKDKEIQGIRKVGLSGLSLPGNNSAMRAIMFNAHQRQCLTPLRPEIANLSTGVEKVIAKISAEECLAKDDGVVINKIVKYEGIIDNPTHYILFFYNKKKDKYSVKEISEVENLTEIYGYQYNTIGADKLNIGDKVKKGYQLAIPTSYDPYGNWRYGVNAHTYYCLDPNTTEDGCKISQSFANRMMSVSADKIDMMINDNDYPLNLYGDEENYKLFPDIGETISEGIIMATRKMVHSRYMYDFREDTLQEPSLSDCVYTEDERASIIDVEIFNNNKELKRSRINSQIFKYLDAQTEFYTAVYNQCKEITDSGSKYTQEIEYLKGRSYNMIEEDKMWRRDDKSFNGVVVRVYTKKYDPAEVTRKITGRHGNKSVIAEVVPDEYMPYTINEDGSITRVDLIENVPALANRTTGAALLEIYQSFLVERLVIHMRNPKNGYTRTQMESEWFELLETLNPEFGINQRNDYNKLNAEAKDKFWNGVLYGNVHPVQCLPYEESGDPYKDEKIYDSYLFSRLYRAGKDKVWAQPSDLYVKDKDTGLPRKVMKPVCLGTMYIMKLKQDGKKQLSVRSTGAVNSKNLPEKSHKNKIHQERHSSTAVRFGESEALNFTCGMSTDDIAYFQALYRTSPEARKDMLEGILKGDKYATVPKEYENLVAVYNNVIFKSLGIEMVEYDRDNEITEIEDTICESAYDKRSDSFVLETPAETMYRERRREAEDYISKWHPGIDTLEFEELVDAYMEDHNRFITEPNVDKTKVVQLMDIEESYDPSERFVFPDIWNDPSENDE